MEMVFGSLGFLLFEVLAWKYGYDSRDGIERDESFRREQWVAQAAARRAALGQRLGAWLGPR
jgi:hypothetical protein